ncbi:LysR family transcriptional regulator [Piscinibacter gummiphilus]|uniref:LysR substrate-binding domain-containing protein n=1 Tax=Piscinibacter gummiphilus TaxID=946333 RepID=A0ABZ0CZ10_9BURK|nr:LysR substrate-binding domain-containing protein [Piscinibacter gummiphilus]WOB10194.1 LysR substrate-binding domain-containing protein [Piscinibacter gummiphilus]
MELSDLRIFVAVVDAGGVSKAADRLHRVQSNVTTRIRQLEEKLGAQLFTRRGRRVVLAEAGQNLLPYARRLLALAQEAREAAAPNVPSGQLRVGAMESTAAARLPKALHHLASTHPLLNVALRTGNPGELAAAVLDGSLDCAFVTEQPDMRPFCAEVAFSEPLVLVSSRKVRLVRATEVDLVVFEQGCPHRQRLEQLAAERSLRVGQTSEIGSYHALLACVSAGMGVSIVPKIVLDVFPHRDLLFVQRLPGRYAAFKTFLVWPKGTMPVKIGALQTALREAA